MKQIVVYTFVLFALLPSIVFARQPLDGELVSLSSYRITSGTTVLRATSTDPFYITNISAYNAKFDDNQKAVLYCGTTRLVEKSQNYQAVGSDDIVFISFDVPYRCSGAVWHTQTTTQGFGFNVVGYSMTTANFDLPTQVATSTASSGGGGGGGGTTDITPDSFDGFYLFFGVMMFAWAVSFYVWYFRKTK